MTEYKIVMTLDDLQFLQNGSDYFNPVTDRAESHLGYSLGEAQSASSLSMLLS